MKKYFVLCADSILHSMVCFNTNFGFVALYEKEIWNTYLDPKTEIIGDPWGEYEIKIVWPAPPKWYKKWMQRIESPIAHRLYKYILNNKALLNSANNK